MGAKTVDFGSHGLSRATTSVGLSTGVGLEVPLRHALCHEGRTSPKLQLGVNLNGIWRSAGQVTRRDSTATDSDGGDYVSMGVVGGVEVPF